MSNYHRAEYEDVAHIFARVETMINTKLLSPNEIMEEFRNEFMDLFTTKGQSFNKTRFLNASKVEERELSASEEPRFQTFGLTEDNEPFILNAVKNDELVGITDEQAGGIIAYGIGMPHAVLIAKALNGVES